MKASFSRRRKKPFFFSGASMSSVMESPSRSGVSTDSD
jgi:hypothetical protein